MTSAAAIADEDAPAVPPVKPVRETKLQRIWRLGSYTIWTVAALALPLALDRLIACPILRERLGKEAFGGLMWVRSLAYMFGNSIANGFSIPFLRDLVKHTADEVRIRMRTALVLTAVLTTILMIVVNLVARQVGGPFVYDNAAALLLPFLAFSLARALELIITVRLRVHRKVRQIFLLRTVEGAVLSVAAMMLSTNSVLVISCLYASSTILPLLLSAFFNRDVLGRGQIWNTVAAKHLLIQAPAGILMVAIDSAQVYAPIILLGAISGQASVSPFYAAGVAYAFLTPVTYVGQAVLNLVAGKKTFDMHGQRGWYYLVTTLGLAAMVGLLSYFVGKPMVSYFYPGDAPVTFTFFHWFAVANGCASVRAMMRPIGLKFARLWTVVLLSGLTLLVQLIALGALIPLWSDKGAAIGLAISSAVSMVFWLGIFEQFRRRPPAAEEIAAAGDIASGEA
jgi:hypothetical protein